MSDDSSNKDHPKNDPSKAAGKKTQELPAQNTCLRSVRPIRESLPFLTHRPGVLIPNHLLAAGFTYTGVGDTARCAECGLEVSNWTVDMVPRIIHSKQSPHCSFVRSSLSSSLPTTAVRRTSVSNEQESPYKHSQIETINSESLSNTFVEPDLLQQVRRRTFSHWSDHNTLTSTGMIEAGFFCCNVGDRVICLYCNLICYLWVPHVDDPWNVHRTLSPNCIYVKALLVSPESLQLTNDNESSMTTTTVHPSLAPGHTYLLQIIGSVRPSVRNYYDIPTRRSSFDTWSHENLPPVDDLVRAGFFYTGTETVVTCFYCNGSIKKWKPKDDPVTKHARWYPHCAYAKQLCGDELYSRIQVSKRIRQERAGVDKVREKTSSGVPANTNVTTNGRQLLIPDESTLTRLVADRLNSTSSQRLLKQGFESSIIERCWKEQLQLKQENFVSDDDLYVACLILQKQIEHIDSKIENILMPSIKMKQIREQNEGRMRELTQGTTRSISNTTDNQMTTSSQLLTNESTSSQSSIESTSKPTTGNQGETKIIKPAASTARDQDQSTSATPANPCVLCFTEEKCLACLPCSHLATCVPCGHSLQSCPICRREIKALIRVYI